MQTEIKDLNGFSITLERQPDGTAILIKGEYIEGDGILDIPEAWHVTKAAPEALKDCQGLTTFNAPKLIQAGNEMFSDCTSLTTFNAPSLIQAGSKMFNDCTSLTTFNAPNLTEGGYAMFDGCTSLTTFNAPELTEVGGDMCFSAGNYMFGRCTSLTSFSAPKLTKASYHMFSDCISLTTFNAPKLTQADDGMFEGCTNLTSVTLSPLFKDTMQNLTGMHTNAVIKTTALRFPVFHFTPSKNLTSFPATLDPRLLQGSRGLAFCLLLCLDRINNALDAANKTEVEPPLPSIPTELASLWCWSAQNQQAITAAIACAPDAWEAQAVPIRATIMNSTNTMNQYATFWQENNPALADENLTDNDSDAETCFVQ